MAEEAISVGSKKASITPGDSKEIKGTDSLKASSHVTEAEEEKLESLISTKTSLDDEMTKAKMFLSTYGETKASVWTHMSSILRRILQEKPANVIDYFEEFSRLTREGDFPGKGEDILQDIFIETPSLKDAKNTITMFRNLTKVKELSVIEEEEEEVEEEEAVKVDIMQKMHYFYLAGVALPEQEILRINLALKILPTNFPVVCIRFWGKIFGTEKDYYIAECEFTKEELYQRTMGTGEGEEEEEEEEAEEDEKKAGAEQEEEQELPGIEDLGATLSHKRPAQGLYRSKGEEEKEGKGKEEDEEGGEEDVEEEKGKKRGKLESYKAPPSPKPIKTEPVTVPPELPGEGTNRKAYLVCNTPEGPWIMLPDVKPEQIVVARKIRKFFTGNLDNSVLSWPMFPGKESDLLRAQLARISAGTQISPLGFYQFEEDEEEEDKDELLEGNAEKEFTENLDFEPYPIKDLADPAVSFWVHHTPHILKQGRTVYWFKKKDIYDPEGAGDEEVEEEEEDGQRGCGEEKKEVGPPLLTPLSEDASLETVPPWSTRLTSRMGKDSSIAVVRSNLWPGAVAYGIGRKFDNIYIGWGLKYQAVGYSPAGLPEVEEEYEVGPEVCEMGDPSVIQEEAYFLAQQNEEVQQVEEEESQLEEDEELE